MPTDEQEAAMKEAFGKDELKQVETKEKAEEKEEEIVEEIEESNPERERAQASGWVPEEEHTGKGVWKDFDEYNRIGDNIAQRAEIKRTKQAAKTAQDSLAPLNSKIARMEKDHIDSLELELKEAVEDADYDKVNQIRSKLDQYRGEVQDESNPMEVWNADNPWITDGSDFSNSVIEQFKMYVLNQSGGVAPTNEVLSAGIAYIEGILAAKPADIQENPNRKAAPKSVRSKRKGSGGKFTESNLSTQDKEDWKHMQEGGFSMTKERFIEIKAEERTAQ
jgi:hypothetical protein